MYDSEQQNCRIMRLLGNTVAKGEHLGPRALCLSGDGEKLAFIGPLEFTVTLLDADTLNEVSDRHKERYFEVFIICSSFYM